MGQIATDKAGYELDITEGLYGVMENRTRSYKIYSERGKM